jgi:hypothetical protein
MLHAFPFKNHSGNSALNVEPPTCSFCFDLLPPAKTSQRPLQLSAAASAATEDKRPGAGSINAACRSTDDTRCTDCQNMLRSQMSPKQAATIARFVQLRTSTPARLDDLQTVGLRERTIGGSRSRARGAATDIVDSPFLIRLRQFHLTSSSQAAADDHDDQDTAAAHARPRARVDNAQVNTGKVESASNVNAGAANVAQSHQSCANQSCEWYVGWPCCMHALICNCL